MNIESMGCHSYGIFWDIENCPIPAMEKASNVVQSIKQFIAKEYESSVGQKSEPCTVVCSCNSISLDARQVEALNRSGVDILHVNPIRAMNATAGMAYKVDADTKLMECIQKFIDHHFNKEKSLLFVITGDIDFAPAIRSAKRRGFEVILLYGTNTSQEMKDCATKSFSYNEIIEPNKCFFDSNTTSKTITNGGNGSHFSGSTASANQTHNRSNGQTKLPQFVQDVQQTVQQIETQNKMRTHISPQNDRQSHHMSVDDISVVSDISVDPEKIKLIQEITQVNKHVAQRVLHSTSGNVQLAINLILND